MVVLGLILLLLGYLSQLFKEDNTHKNQSFEEMFENTKRALKDGSFHKGRRK